MRLPRRHPFTSHSGEAEIAHLHSLFYPHPSLPVHQAQSQRQRGVDLVQSLYLAKGGCPVAIECTSSLTASLLLDYQLSTAHRSSAATLLTPPPALSLAIRQTLSLSLIRLVNTLADALQKGAVARSIASIAERQLGLPHWFVEFRHRGTHEELPSLEVCREVVASALVWIEGAFWLPTLREAEERTRIRTFRSRLLSATQTGNAAGSVERDGTPPPRQQSSRASNALLFPSGVEEASSSSLAKTTNLSEQLERHHLPELYGILRSYKRLSKTLVRDQSLRGRSRNEVQAIYRQVDRWLDTVRRDMGYDGNAVSTREALFSGSRRFDRRRKTAGWASGEDDDGIDDDDDIDDGASASSEADMNNDGLGISHSHSYHFLSSACFHDPALGIFVTALLSPTPGVGLIPLSKSKRATHFRNQDGAEELGEMPSLPEELLIAWSGLLNHLGGTHADRGENFISTWFGTTIDLLLEEVSPSASAAVPDFASARTRLDASSSLTLLAWVKFILDSLCPSINPNCNLTSSRNDEVASLRRSIAFHLLYQEHEDGRGPKTHPSPKSVNDSQQALLLSLVKKLLNSIVKRSKATAVVTSATAATTETLLRDVTSRLGEAARLKVEKVICLLPSSAITVALSEGEGKSHTQLGVEQDMQLESSGKQQQEKKRRLSDEAVAAAEREKKEVSPLLYGFEHMDTVIPLTASTDHVPSQMISCSETVVAEHAGIIEVEAEAEEEGTLNKMQEMERRWRQVLASSSAAASSSSTASSSVAPTSKRAKIKKSSPDLSAGPEVGKSSSSVHPITDEPIPTLNSIPAVAALPAPVSVPAPIPIEPSFVRSETHLPLPTGWTLYPAEDWRPTPIGMLRCEAGTTREGQQQVYVPDFLALPLTPLQSVLR